jgi:hypothetical protein
LTNLFHAIAIQSLGTVLVLVPLKTCHGCDRTAEKNMKIYLLLLLIGTLLTAIRFTTAPERRSETHPQ